MAKCAESDSKIAEYDLVIPVANDQSPFPYFSEPQVLGCYSLDANRNFTDGPERLKYCEFFEGTKKVNFNLDEACKKSVEAPDVIRSRERLRKEENSQLKHVRRWIDLHLDIFLERRPHFVLRRGVLRKILLTPYEEKEEWTLAAMYKTGTIYVRNILWSDTNAKLRKAEKRSNARIRQFCSWGEKFEDFLLSDDPGEEPNPENAGKGECDLVLMAQLKHREILYTAELDGIWASGNEPSKSTMTPEFLNSCRFVELKTTREFPGCRTSHHFRNFILRKWWCQAYLGRVKEIVIGSRPDDGIVRKLDVMQVSQIPSLARGWSPAVCFDFLDRFLDEVENIVGENEDVVCVFKYDPRHRPAKEVCLKVIQEEGSDKLLPDLL